MEIITGILLGISTLIFMGPVFFYLLKSTLDSGVKAGIAVAVGFFTGDLIYVIIAVKGIGSYFESPHNQKILSVAGGFLLIFLGIKYLLQKRILPKEQKTVSKNNWIYFLNGFLINFANPFVFGVWIGFFAIVQSKTETDQEVVTALVCTLLTILITDILKVLFAHRIKRWIQPHLLHKIYKGIGILMIGFGLRLLCFIF